MGNRFRRRNAVASPGDVVMVRGRYDVWGEPGSVSKVTDSATPGLAQMGVADVHLTDGRVVPDAFVRRVKARSLYDLATSRGPW